MKIETGEIAWNVQERGEADLTLVFLHYFGGSGRAWLDVMTRLERDCRCIAPDLRGFGESSDVTSNYTVARAADDVQELIAALGIGAYILVGHSMGGKIALRLAANSPPGLRGLILVAPSPPTPEPMEEQARAQSLATHGSLVAARETVAKITAHPLPPELLAQTLEDNVQTSSLAWKWWLESGSREDITPQVTHIAVPILTIAGAKDPVIPVSLVETAIVERFATSPARIVPDAGHLLPLEAAEALSDIMRPFISAPGHRTN